MITNDGKEVVSKFLLGQVPTFATHLSIGCGATPLLPADALPTGLHDKKRMDFETTRVPISSKGFVDASVTHTVTNKQLTSNVATLTLSAASDILVGETIIVAGVDSTFNGQFTVTNVSSTLISYALTATNVSSTAVSPTGTMVVSRTKISLTAELPSDNRYAVTEVGVWSTGSNSLANQYDSRMLFTFDQRWQIHSTSISEPTKLALGAGAATDISTTEQVFYADTNDSLFQISNRRLRHEGPRNLNTTMLVRGDLSTITGAINADWVGSGTHVHLNDINFDISGNNASDILKLAFSMIDKAGIGSTAATDAKILMEFYRTEANTTSGYAKMQVYVPGSLLSTNRYYVGSATISQTIDHSNEANSTSLPYVRFYTSSDFSASEIRVCRIFVQVTDSGAPSGSDHYICFDGFRIDNTTENPSYKMTGYSIIRKDGTPITKLANTNNYVDFRFSLGVS